MFVAAALSLLSIGSVSLVDDPALPSPVAAALAASVDDGDRADWRFTIEITRGGETVRGRFDGTLAEADQWTLIHPEDDQMSDDLRSVWEDIMDPSEDEDEGGGLFFSSSDLDYQPGSFMPIGSEGGARVYGFSPVVDADGMDLSEYLRGEMAISASPERVQQIRIFAEESFKPNFAVRINAFEMTQDFVQLEGLPAPVMQRMVQRLEGSAAFQTFEQTLEIEFSEIEYLAD